MTKEELKQEAEEYLASENYFDGFVILPSAVAEAYIKGAEPREKRIEELEKEKCELLGIIQGKDKAIAELKLKLEALDGQTPWKDIKDKSEVVGQLAKAKGIIKNLLFLHNDKFGQTKLDWRCNVIAEAERFLSGVENEQKEKS